MPRAEVCRRRMRDAIAFAHDSRPPVVRQLPGNHPECAPASVKWPVARISGTLVPTERATKTISPRDYGPSERERRHFVQSGIYTLEAAEEGLASHAYRKQTA